MSDDETTDDGPPNDAPRAPTQSPRPADATTDRRGALSVLVGVGSLAYAGALAVPGVRFLTDTGTGDAGDARTGDGGAHERFRRIAKLAELPEGTPERVKIVGDTRDAFTVTRGQTLGSVWLLRSGDSVRALSAECPHLGCAIDLGGDGKSYGCPCHTSRFSLEGQAESGPSPRGMDELAVRIVDGHVEVDFRRFRQGVTERVEAG